MIAYWYYIIAIIIPLVLVPLGVWLNKKVNNQLDNNNKLDIVFKVVGLIIGITFLFRYMLGQEAIQEMFKLTNTPFESGGLAVLGLLLVWATYAGSLLCSLFGFFKSNLTSNLIKCLALPLSVFGFAGLYFEVIAIEGVSAIDAFSLRAVLLSIEIGLALALSLVVLITQKTTFKQNKGISINVVPNVYKPTTFWAKVWFGGKQVFANVVKFFKNYWFYIALVLVIFLAVMPPYTMQGLFGEMHQNYAAKDLTIVHRMILYVGLLLPVVLHFTLKNKDYATKKFVLLYICLGTLISFSLHHRFASFADPTNWPLHLCNTAMYIMPIVLIFNMRRFFYFTYFINVVGAFFAMIMPNYLSTLNLYSTQLDTFYINHFIAFFMPILFVSLKMFERPKLKQFIYSMLGFLAYFVLVLILNAYFTGAFEVGRASSTTDFFFINSDFIADKLGQWCERLRDITATVMWGDIKLTFYPVYQTLFFIAYVFIGLAVWFIYEQAYQISANFEDMRKRKEKIKLDKLALLSQLNGRSVTQPMKEEYKDMLVLQDFCKRYGTSDVYAVKDANLEVHSGEVFGFLGPNGAGKSTIIKTIVGIQPITSGSIFVCGYDVDKQPVMAKRQLGYVPDTYALYEKLTGREYINYIADLYGVSKEDRTARIDEYLQRFNLKGAFDNQMKTYSHGMKQKIAIMSALVHNPKIWILDEPLMGLDPDSIYQVKECMKEHAKKGNIVFFSSHLIDVVEKVCTRIAIIKKGHIITTKTLKEIEDSGTPLEKFYMDSVADTEEEKQEIAKFLDTKKKDNKQKVDKQQKKLEKQQQKQNKKEQKNKDKQKEKQSKLKDTEKEDKW